MLRDKIRENLEWLAAFGVAVVVIILGLTVNFDTIKNWFSGTEILVSSASGVGTEFLAGEKLRFLLKNVQSSRVFWVFDETDPIGTSVEVEYAFPFEEGIPRGQARDRRIDAFFKAGDTYKVATKMVRTRNVKFTTQIDLDNNQFTVTADTSLDAKWSLTGASLVKHVAGLFARGVELPVVSAPNGQVGTITVDRKIAADALGYAQNVDLKSKINADSTAWMSYEFSNATDPGKKLTIVEPFEKK
jgi:hypothetical protein